VVDVNEDRRGGSDVMRGRDGGAPDTAHDGPPQATAGPGGERARRPAEKAPTAAAGVRVLHVRIEGVVQGVGFRWFVREYAVRLGVRGWVRNLTDGAVEVVAAGEVAPLTLLASALRHGPPDSSVTAVVPLPPLGDDELPNPFTILRHPPRPD
jgi:acylphosphatase